MTCDVPLVGTWGITAALGFSRGRVNSANVSNSARLRQVLALLLMAREAGVTTADILRNCPLCRAAYAAVDELRDNGIDISYILDGASENGGRFYRYRYVGYNPDPKKDKFLSTRVPGWTPRSPGTPSHLIDSDPPAPVADSDSPTDLGYREIPEPPPDVPGHLIGEVIRFERMGKAEREKYRIVCEGHVAENICILCKWCCDGSHEDVFPSYARKAHVLTCCNPALDSNRDYLAPLCAAPVGCAADPHRGAPHSPKIPLLGEAGAAQRSA